MNNPISYLHYYKKLHQVEIMIQIFVYPGDPLYAWNLDIMYEIMMINSLVFPICTATKNPFNFTDTIIHIFAYPSDAQESSFTNETIKELTMSCQSAKGRICTTTSAFFLEQPPIAASSPTAASLKKLSTNWRSPFSIGFSSSSSAPDSSSLQTRSSQYTTESLLTMTGDQTQHNDSQQYQVHYQIHTYNKSDLGGNSPVIHFGSSHLVVLLLLLNVLLTLLHGGLGCTRHRKVKYYSKQRKGNSNMIPPSPMQ